MLVALTLVAACSWNHPGADPTISDPIETLTAMGIDSPELARMIRTDEYEETVTIHRNDHRISGMSSGNAKWCEGEVDTSGWAADHEEQGRVYRLGNLAVVWYWRCHNLSRWLGPTPAVAGPAFMDGANLSPAGPIGNFPVYATPIPITWPGPIGGDLGAEGNEGGGLTPGGFGGGSGGFGGASCPCLPPPCVAVAVPEPSTLWMLMTGLLVTMGFLRRRS